MMLIMLRVMLVIAWMAAGWTHNNIIIMVMIMIEHRIIPSLFVGYGHDHALKNLNPSPPGADKMGIF